MPSEDDPLLREVAAWARDRAAAEREQLDERWDRLAAGTLSPEEEAELRAEAETSAASAAALAAFQPLGPESEARIVAQIRAQRAAERPAVAAPRLVVAAPADERSDHQANDRPNNVLPFRRRAAAWGGGLGLAAAAILFAVLILPGLPTYVAEIKGGDVIARGVSGSETAGLRRFSQGSRFELVLRPAQAIEGDVAVRCLLVAAGGGPPRPFPACDHPQRSDDGSLRVTGTVGSQIEYLPGDWTLWAFVARPDDLPSRAAEPIAGKGWIRIPQSIRFGPSA